MFTNQPYQSSVSVNKDMRMEELVFFYEDEQGNVIEVGEKEAHIIENERKGILGNKRFRQIGCSDGLIFREKLKEIQEIFQTKGLEEAQLFLKHAREKEIEAARGKLRKPRNYGYTDIQGNPTTFSELKRI